MDLILEAKLRLTFWSCILLLLRVGCAVRPLILKGPDDVVVKKLAGTPSSFTVFCIKLQGSIVEWYRNGTPLNIARDPDLQVSSDGSLHVKNAQKQRDEGNYYCTVSSGKQSVISSTAAVRFAYLGSFSVGDWIVEKDQDELTVLKCMPPSSFPVRDIHWAKITGDGKQPLTQSTHYVVSQEGDLHFAFVDKKDSGQYVCTVSNMFLKRNVVRTISLDVLPVETSLHKPPKVADEFTVPKTVLKGEKFVLECIVYGKPVPRIILKKRGLHMTLGRTAGNVRRLVIKSFSQDDAGRYRCKASDQSGLYDSKTTVITMEAKPEWITRPRKTIAGSNTTVVLPCVAFGIPSVKYTWYFNGRPMIWMERHMFKEGNLTIKGLTTADNGIYQCFVKNKHGEMHADMELSVSEIPAGFGPGSRTPETNQNALINTRVEITCNPTGEPKPTVSWLFGAMHLQGNGRYRILPNGNLIIHNVTKEDSGEYTCKASNKLGEAYRKGFLNVLEYIVVTENIPAARQTSQVVQGHDIQFMCGVLTLNGIEISFQWSKYSIPIVSNPHVTVWRTDYRNKRSLTREQRGYLKINGARYSDAGWYQCQALGNNEVITTKDVVLVVQGPPDPPTNVDIQNAINRREYVNVTWTLGKSNSSPIRKVVIQCITQFSPHTWETIAEESDPHKGWTQISLSPWRRYSFRAVAVNGIGNSTPSSQSSSFQAPSTAPSQYPQEVRGEGTSPSTLSITWKLIPPINHNGPGLYYVVYYQRADGGGELFRREVKNQSSFIVSGTDYYVKYMIQLQAANDIGFGPKSPAVFAYSGEKIPIGSPRDLDVRITSPTSAYATWTGVPDTREAVRGKLLGYKVYFWRTPSGQTPHNDEFEATIDTSTTLHLQAYTSYRFQVVAYNSIGDGPESNVVGPLTTPESKWVGSNGTRLCSDAQDRSPFCPGDLPGSPRDLSLHVQNQSFILLQWNPPEHINGIITGYQVTAQKLPASTTAITGYTNDSSTEISFHHLDPRAKYEISILAVNRIGKGPPVVSTFDLTAAPHVSPYNVAVVFDEINKEARLSWKSSLKDNEGFRIFYWRKDAKIQTVDVDKMKRQERVFLGLDSEYKYHFEIAAFKIQHGGHYILGPRSKRVTAGKVKVTARSIQSAAVANKSSSMLLLGSMLFYFMSLQWLQVR